MIRLLPWLAALLGTFVYHRYTISSGFDAVQADIGDSRYIAFMLEHWNVWAHGHARLGSPLMFWPRQGTLGYSDALAGMGLVHVLLRASGLGVFVAMNLQLVLLSLAAFAAGYWFLRRGFRIGVPAATVGAYFFAFSWPGFAELVHVQMQFTFELPLMALFALEALRDGPALARVAFGWRVLAVVTLLFATCATTVYMAEFALLFLTLIIGITLLRRGARQSYGCIIRRHWPALLAGMALAALLAWPIAHVYLPVMQQSGGRDWAEVRRFLFDPADLFWMGRENYVWGWLFGHWHARTLENWAGKRVGVGLIATLAWLAACTWAVRMLAGMGRGPLDRGGRDRAIAGVAILVTAGLQLATLRVGDASPWWLIWTVFPGMGGIRTIGRLQLVAALPMGLAFALLIERAQQVRWSGAVLAGLVGLAAMEQTGMVQRYSAASAQALGRKVADAIPRTCTAAYVMATRSMMPPPTPVADEAHFDAAAYLLANPDVAQAWAGSAWQHYVLFGRKEERRLDPAAAINYRALMYFYNYTIPLGAMLAGIPVANGLSGWQPPGWALFDVLSPAAPERLAAWMTLNHRDPASICQVRIDMPYDSLDHTELWTD